MTQQRQTATVKKQGESEFSTFIFCKIQKIIHDSHPLHPFLYSTIICAQMEGIESRDDKKILHNNLQKANNEPAEKLTRNNQRETQKMSQKGQNFLLDIAFSTCVTRKNPQPVKRRRSNQQVPRRRMASRFLG